MNGRFLSLVFGLLLVVSARCQSEDDGRIRVKIPVKRLHSRQRRYIAPGARWDVLLGWETFDDTFDIHSYVAVKYYMDYLFGGTTAYQALLAANNAANTAFVATKAAVLAGQQPPTILTGSTVRFVGSTGLPSGPPPGLTPGRRKRGVREDILPFKIESKTDNILIRSVAEDQVEIFRRVEESLERLGLSGRQCVLRAICELSETPIHDRNLMAETISLFFKPKSDNITKLGSYQRADEIGRENGDCWSVYSECPFSIFSYMPGVDSDLNLVFDKVETGAKVSPTNYEDQINNVFESLKTFHDPKIKPVIVS